MCDCEMPSTINTIERKARTAHKCCECDDTISPGDKYEYTSGVWDGRGASFKTCLRCAGVRSWYVHECLPTYECWPCFGDLYQDATDFGNQGTIPDLTEAAKTAGYL